MQHMIQAVEFVKSHHPCVCAHLVHLHVCRLHRVLLAAHSPGAAAVSICACAGLEAAVLVTCDESALAFNKFITAVMHNVVVE
jgi:hypothetical protein